MIFKDFSCLSQLSINLLYQYLQIAIEFCLIHVILNVVFNTR